MEARLPAHLEISALLRMAQNAGGFATVLKRGESDSGVILLVTLERGANAQLYERMPQLDGTRRYTLTRSQVPEKPEEFPEYLARRQAQDSDLWLIELDVPNAERFVASIGR